MKKKLESKDSIKSSGTFEIHEYEFLEKSTDNLVEIPEKPCEFSKELNDTSINTLIESSNYEELVDPCSLLYLDMIPILDLTTMQSMHAPQLYYF